MILVDTSVWVDHLRSSDLTLAALLLRGAVVTHPHVIGEIALGSLARWKPVLTNLGLLPLVVVATDSEVLAFVERAPLFGLGIGYVDAHLLASLRLTPGTSLWTRDRKLNDAAATLGIATV